MAGVAGLSAMTAEVPVNANPIAKATFKKFVHALVGLRIRTLNVPCVHSLPNR